MEGVTLRSDIQEQNAEHGSGTQPDPGGSPDRNIPALPPPDPRESKAYNMQLWVSLLVVIFLGSLGSLSLAPHMLPDLVRDDNAAGKQVQVTHLATPILPTPTPVNGPFLEEECTATAKNMKYLSSSGTASTSGKAIPFEWLQAGRDQKDFVNAQACAVSFINTYQTFNAADPKTFETSISMLTAGARQRFYGNTLNTQPDWHMDPMRRAALLKQQIRQSTQSSQPDLLAARYTNGNLLVWMVVSCQITIQAAGSKPVIENDQYTVLLLGVPINAQKTGTGWQVSQWQEGRTQFTPPHLL